MTRRESEEIQPPLQALTGHHARVIAITNILLIVRRQAPPQQI